MKEERIKKSILIFLVLTFGLPGICLFFSKNLRIFQSGTLSFILYGIEAATPTLAALIVITASKGISELQSFLKKCYYNNVKVFYIVLAIILPLTVMTITKLTSFIVFNDKSFTTNITLRKLTVIIWALVAEEVGWRGFLQEKLKGVYGHITTPMLTGLIWALWHYHFFLSGATAPPLILFGLGCIADSFGYYWVTNKTRGNVIPASVWHFTGNLGFNLCLISPEHNGGSIIPYLLFVIYSTIMAVGISIWGVLSEKRILA